jgi:hypothetical protein
MLDLVVGGIVLWLLGIVYLAPSLMAARRNAGQLPRVLILNTFAGWTLVGWLRALRLALRRAETPRAATGRDEQAWQALPYATDVFRPRIPS